MGRVLVIGCGNADAGDDALGIVAVSAARAMLESIPGVEVVPEGSPLQVVHLVEGADAVVVVDAIRTPAGGREPGTPVRVVLEPGDPPAAAGSSLSSHGFGVAEAFGLAGALGATARVVLLGLEAADLVAGRPISRPVAAALPHLTEMVVSEARTLAAEAERSPSDGPIGPTRGNRTNPGWGHERSR